MKIALAAVITIAAFVLLHIPPTKKKRQYVLAFYAFAMIVLFVTYNVRTLKNIIMFTHPKNQSMYQPEFLEKGEYPDAFLDVFFRGKTVYTPDDAYEVRDDINVNEETPDLDRLSEETGDYWLYFYYHAVNMWDYLKLNDAVVVKDASLNGIVLTDDQKAAFSDLGSANDMMRYTFPLTPYNGEWGNGFYYYWFYNTFIGDSRVYVCTEDIMDADELVVLWQHEDTHDTDSYYIAARSYFDGVIR